MKKITFLIFLLITSIGYSQIIVEDFEGTAPAIVSKDGATGSISTTQAIDTKSLEIISAASGQPWQQVELMLQADLIDLRTNKTVTASVYSTTAFTLLAKVFSATNASGTGAGADSATSDSHAGGGWQTLTFNFAAPEDNTAVANDAYQQILFIPNWAGNDSGTNGDNADFNNAVDGTYYVDNITAFSIPRTPTCSDGVMNQDETGIDCGGASCDACDVVPVEAPDPTNGTGVADADVLSVFNDAGDFSTSFTTDFAFGEEFRTIVDLDPGTGVNEAVKIEFDRGSWGAGNNTEAELIAAGYTHYNFSYYMPTLTPGAEGHLLQIILASRTPGMGQAADAVINITETASATDSYAVLEFDKWVNLSIPLSAFTNFETHLLLYKFATPSTAFSPLVFIDNVFFSKSAVTLSTDDFNLVELSAYPNPSNTDWNIKTSNTVITSVEVFNLLGKSVLSKKYNSTDITISTDGLSNGIYLAKVTTDLGTKSIKLIKG